jgi:hypothetical protein
MMLIAVWALVVIVAFVGYSLGHHGSSKHSPPTTTTTVVLPSITIPPSDGH